jgi:hypothetical protein
MTPQRLLKTGIIPALADLEQQGIPDSVDARRFLLAIAMQESGLAHRRQVSTGGGEGGPGASFWQFEQGGGCKGVLTHKSVAARMVRACDDNNVFSTPQGLWEAMRYNDIVAATAARLLIYTLPSGLPKTAEDGWRQYIAAWRPGKPHEDTWGINWGLATVAVGLKL